MEERGEYTGGSKFESRTKLLIVHFLACKKQVLSIRFSFYYFYLLRINLILLSNISSAKVITGNSTFSRFSLKSPLTASKQYNH